MKYSSGQTVMLLDTEYKPAGSAIICHYEENSNRYEVNFTYPGHDRADIISVPAERIILPTSEFMHD